MKFYDSTTKCGGKDVTTKIPEYPPCEEWVWGLNVFLTFNFFMINY